VNLTDLTDSTDLTDPGMNRQTANSTTTDAALGRTSRGVPAWFDAGWAVALLFALLALLFYLPIVLGLRTFPDGDFTHHFLSFSWFFQSEILDGRLPVWAPFTYAGHPFLADVQTGVFYPPATLLLLATLPWQDPGARLYLLELEAIGQVALAGYFTYLLVHSLTRTRWAAVLAGILFAFSGYLAGYPPVQLAVLRTAIWLPLILWTVLGGVRAPARWRWWVGMGASLAVAFLAGHSQTFLYIIYVTAIWIVVLVVARLRHDRIPLGDGVAHPPHPGSTASRDDSAATRPWRPLLLGLGLGMALALGLSAAQLLPSLEYVQLSVRANVDYAYVSGGFPIQDSWQMLLPHVLTSYSPLYVGVVGLGLAFMALGVRAREFPAPGVPSAVLGIGFFGVVTLFALLVSYGAEGFLYPIVYRLLPGWNLFRGQERAAYLVAFGLSVLAGYGAAALPAMHPARRAWLATLFAGLVIAGTYVFGLLWQLPGRTAVGQGEFLLIATVTIALAATFAVMLRLPGWSRRRTALLLVLAGANLFWANAATNVDSFGPARKAILPPEVEALQQAVAETAGDNVGLPGRVYNEFRVYEDYGLRAGVEDVWGASPLRLARYAALFAEFPLDRMWRLLGVEHVLTWRRELFAPSTLRAEYPQATDTTYLHRLRAPNPRAWLVAQVQPATDEEAVQLLADHQFDLEMTALLPADLVAAIASAPPGASTVKLRQVSPSRLQVEVAGEQDGLLVVSENWMPGWRVEGASPAVGDPVLGLTPFTVNRANLTLLGIPVPAGSWRFDLVYDPDSVRYGLWISGATLALLGLGGAAVLLWRRRKAATQPR
jgi:hypothetical protein